MQEGMVEWGIFFTVIMVLLAADLYLGHKKRGHMAFKDALILTIIWVSVALLFGAFVFFRLGQDYAMQYVTAYAIEEAMSMDNLFVFILLFSVFQIEEDSQHKALFFGVFGAIIFRAIFVVVGVELLHSIDFMMYVFGILLVFMAGKTAFEKKSEDRSKIADFLMSKMKVGDHDGNRFFTVKNGVRYVTPLLVCVIAIELTDLIFAVDSIPACLAVSDDIFIVYTSNMFAVMGLRSLYFVIHGSLQSLRFMKYGLSAILLFVGMKMIFADIYEIPILMSLFVIVGVMAVTILVSVLYPAKDADGRGCGKTD